MSQHHPAARTIVVADDDTDLVDLLTQRCTLLGCTVIGVHSAIDALNAIHRARPDLVCIDVNMPAGNGLSVCEMMAGDEQLRTVPVVVLTGNADEQTIRRCHDMMIYYVEKNVDVWSRIEPLIKELLLQPDESRTEPYWTPVCEIPPQTSCVNAPAPPGEAPGRSERCFQPATSLADAVFAMLGANADLNNARLPTDPAAVDAPPSHDEPPWVLCIDDDADFSDALKCRLEACGVAVVRAFNGMEGYRLAFTNPASAILLDYNMPNGQGDYVLQRLSDNPVTSDIPVIVITGVRDKSLERKMYGLGAKRFLNKPVRFETLRDELAQFIDILNVPANA